MEGGGIKGSVLKLLKMGVGKGRNCSQGERVLKLSPPPCSLQNNLIVYEAGKPAHVAY